jgi:hypothetical protein
MAKRNKGFRSNKHSVCVLQGCREINLYRLTAGRYEEGGIRPTSKITQVYGRVPCNTSAQLPWEQPLNPNAIENVAREWVAEQFVIKQVEANDQLEYRVTFDERHRISASDKLIWFKDGRYVDDGRAYEILDDYTISLGRYDGDFDYILAPMVLLDSRSLDILELGGQLSIHWED